MKASIKPRFLAGFLILCLAGTETCSAFPAFAAGAKAGVDETVYVNLDLYGTAEEVNVVKALSLNGTSEYTDYGAYQKVLNMSDRTEPVLGEDSVTWSFPEGRRERFYFQCSMDPDQTVLPWTFDVSYKLNGVPVEGEALAGASGLVELHIQAKPNETAAEYYRNNMILLAAVPADMEQCYSLEAEGAQMQNIGGSSFAVFTALPGEEGDFTVRIGTDCFESIGIVLMMTPGTLKDLERIQDINEAKDTWSDAGDELYESMDDLAASMEAMRGGVGQLMAGLQSAESARQTWSAAKDGILAGNDQTLESLSNVSDSLETMIPHIQTAKDSAQVVHESLGDLVDVLNEMRDPMDRLATSLRRLSSRSESVTGNMDEFTKLMEQLIALDAQLSASEQIYITGLGQLSSELAQLEEGMLAGQAGAGRTASSSDADFGAVSGIGTDTGLAGNPGFSGGAGGAMDTQQLLAALMAKKTCLEQLSAASNRMASRMSSLLDATGDSARRTAQLLETMDWFIEDLTAMQDTLDQYYPDLQESLTDAGELVSRTSEALKNGTDTLNLVQDALKESSDEIDAAARDSILGSLELLDRSLGALDATSAMRSASRTMKDTADQEWDKLEEETRFLSIDPSAKKRSFTSEKNQEPDTLQIILRTEEISLDDTKELLDAETEKEEMSPLSRMWNVLVKIWNAIVEIFKER